MDDGWFPPPGGAWWPSPGVHGDRAVGAVAGDTRAVVVAVVADRPPTTPGAPDDERVVTTCSSAGAGRARRDHSRVVQVGGYSPAAVLSSASPSACAVGVVVASVGVEAASSST